jgi:enamine deaminase RidA (YjgF/YER057c/UK114 family)
MTLAAVLASIGCGRAEEAARVSGPHGGYAAYASEEQKKEQDAWGYAGAYRAGDYVFLSGVVAGAGRKESISTDEFKERLRGTFRHADETLKAAGASLADVVDLVSFHVFASPRFEGDKMAHFNAVAEVKREFMPGPDPAWTAIGVAELLPDSGLVEIRMVAYAPIED